MITFGQFLEGLNSAVAEDDETAAKVAAIDTSSPVSSAGGSDEWKDQVADAIACLVRLGTDEAFATVQALLKIIREAGANAIEEAARRRNPGLHKFLEDFNRAAAGSGRSGSTFGSFLAGLAAAG